MAGLLLALPAYSQKIPDFTGVWQLQTQMSEFGSLPAPQSSEVSIKQLPERVVFRSFMVMPGGRELEMSMQYWLDGKEHREVSRGQEFRTMTRWKGSVLEVTNTVTVNGKDITNVDQWSLSLDNKYLTVVMRIPTPRGEIRQKLVYLRQATLE